MGYRHLNIFEREVILKMKFSGNSQAGIAGKLGRSKSAISRELRRNSGPPGYEAHLAQKKYEKRRRRSKHPVRMEYAPLAEYAREGLEKTWSPEQIAGRIKIDCPGDGKMRAAHSTIYRWIQRDKLRGGELHLCLRQRFKKRRKRYGSRDLRGQIKNRVSIEKRPAIVEERSRLGDWESDTIEGKGKKGYIATHVERKSRYLVAAKLPNKKAETFNRKTVRAFRGVPKKFLKTITADNGKEFAWHEKLAAKLEMEIYFAHPYHSWERGLNENTNGLLREFFPKGMDLRKVSEKDVDRAAGVLNNRPRKCLGYRAPAEVFAA